MKTITMTIEPPVRHEVDIAIIGGGPAGVAAAIAAASGGKSVYLAEATGCFGGMGTAGLVPAFMQFSDGEHFLAEGVGRMVLQAMWDSGGKVEGSVYSIPTETLKRTYDALLAEVDVICSLMTRLTAVDVKNGVVKHAIFHGKSGFFAIKAHYFVDATGDGDLCAMAGGAYEKGDENGCMMPGTLCSLWANIDWKRVKPPDRRALKQAIEDGVFSVPDQHLSGMWKTGRTLGGGNIGHSFDVDGTDERSLTEALMCARKRLSEFELYYKRYLTGYENMELAATGQLMGIRETRRITCDYRMDLNDFKKRADFDDEIGRYSYPVDIHPKDASSKEYEKFADEFTRLRYDKGESYGIPYRSLLPRGLTNVVTAGRCIGTDRYMQSSVRVMPACYITGQAAGLACVQAGLQHTDLRGFEISKLQRALVEFGAYLPRFS